MLFFLVRLRLVIKNHRPGHGKPSLSNAWSQQIQIVVLDDLDRIARLIGDFTYIPCVGDTGANERFHAMPAFFAA